MVKTSILHCGLSLAYFSSKVHSWVGLEWNAFKIPKYKFALWAERTKMVKTSILHCGLSLAYFSSKVHSWVGLRVDFGH